MKRHIDRIVSIFFVAVTGSLGYIQSELELRKFVPQLKVWLTCMLVL